MLEFLWYALKVLLTVGAIIIVLSIMIKIVASPFIKARKKKELNKAFEELNNAIEEAVEELKKQEKQKKNTKKSKEN